MSQQGERSTGHEDDWWGQLYDDSTEDTGPTAAGDSLDDRFASASGTVDASQADAVFGRESVSEKGDDLGAGPLPPLPPRPSQPAPTQDSPPAPAWRSQGEGRTPEPPFSGPGPGVPPQRGGAPYGTWDVRRGSGPGRPRAPWEPPPAMPSRPVTFPPGPKPPGFRDRTPAPSADSGGTLSPTETPTTPAPGRAPTPEKPPGAPGRLDGEAAVDPPAPGTEFMDAGAGAGAGEGVASAREAARAASSDASDSADATGAPWGALPRPSAAPGAGFVDAGGVGYVGSAREGGRVAGSEVPDSVDVTGAVWDVPLRPSAPPGPVSVSASASARESSPAQPSGDASAGEGGQGWGSPGRPASGKSPHSAWGSPPAEPPRDATPADSGQDSPLPNPPSRRTPTRPDLPALPPETPKALEPPESSGTPGSAVAVAIAGPPTTVDYVGSGPPTYAPEPTALPPADPDDLGDLVADTVLDGAQYGACTLRAVSLRGDSARFRGEPRRDSLLTARFGTGDHALVLIAMATGARATPGAHRAAAEACQWIGRAVGRSHVRLAEDLRAARRGDLKSGLHRLTDRSLGKLRASAAEQGIEPEEYTAGLRCLLLPADPDCRTRVFFGVGAGGLFRLRDGEWQDIEPRVADIPAGEPVVGFGSLPHETPDGDRLTMDLGITTPPSPYEPAPEPPREPFRFRASVARPGDTLLLCTGGLAEPLRGEPELCEYLTGRWSGGTPPGLAAFLADTQVRVKGYADDRTAAAVWET
ncbi:protein phosphatase 2C domain-containing protein [Streptomyces sp. NBC_00576]|uniref:protein phosphatase 2C domain-containing protein n=1 Tax=Streptomyces sp. NBC_00576 TaxID=2903665 RepID=UPI002E81AF77|nr:protein phosphatase 2C domain-containing protein [Streptomyces sp. NBC_00576]WUB70228.1 protein phosphatase 2C domain-containing protein [Streptomyces sp. NBC_00576]